MEAFHYRYHPLAQRTRSWLRRATYAYQLEAFRDAVVQGKQFVTTTAEAVKTMQLVDAIYQAAGMSPRAGG